MYASAQTKRPALGFGQITIFGLPPHRVRAAFRAIFSFGGTLSSLDSSQVSNIAAAKQNARAFASEVVALLKTNAGQLQAQEVA